MSKQKEDPPYVLEQVCDARMKSLENYMKVLFGSSILTIALIIVQILRGA